MNYDGFITYCFAQGINTDVIKAYRDAVMKDAGWCLHREQRYAGADLGHAELSNITTVDQGIEDIKNGIKWATCDYDALGRSKEKVLLKQLIRDANKFPRNKYLVRRIAKTFYLLDGVGD